MAGGIALAVRLTPKGGRDAIDGIAQLADGRSVLKARVRGGAERRRGQCRAVRLIAKAVGVPPRDVRSAAGATARIKRLAISGDRPS